MGCLKEFLAHSNAAETKTRFDKKEPSQCSGRRTSNLRMTTNDTHLSLIKGAQNQKGSFYGSI
jgi:hypothetical protein